MTYSQQNPAWASVAIRGSSYSVGQYGCLLTAFATALNLAGWPVTPFEVATRSIFDAGLFDWYKAANSYPQATFSPDASRQYKLVRVTGTFPSGYVGEHWLLLADGTYYDPLNGSSFQSLPSNYAPSGFVRSYDIVPLEHQVINVSQASAPAPDSQFSPFGTNLSPSQTFNPEVARMQSYLIAKGYMQDQGANDGYYGLITASAVSRFQQDHGIVAGPRYYGWWYDRTRAAANQDLSPTPNQSA